MHAFATVQSLGTMHKIIKYAASEQIIDVNDLRDFPLENLHQFAKNTTEN
jgi:hypothetical protein